MKLCPKCGTLNEDDSIKCSCGADIVNVPITVSEEIEYEPEVEEEENDEQSAAPAVEAFMSSNVCNRLVWLFLILAVAGAFICSRKFNSPELAVISASAFITVAITFAALGGLLKNQEIQTELLRELLDEIRNKS